MTTEIVKKLCENAEGGESLAGAKALFQAYRSACHYGDDENDGDEASVRLASSSAFHELVQYTLTNADGILRGLLGVESRDDEDAFKPHANARWKKVQPLAKSYIGNTLHLLGNLTDAEMTAMVIRQLKTVTPFMATFERLTKRVTRSALHCFGSGEPSVRVQAILLLRAMAVGLPPPSLERVAKGVYRTFASNAKFLNAESVEHIVFMSTCVVEIFGLDQQQSYPLAFTYIRQLASLLRGALTAKSKEAFRTSTAGNTSTVSSVGSACSARTPRTKTRLCASGVSSGAGGSRRGASAPVSAVRSVTIASRRSAQSIIGEHGEIHTRGASFDGVVDV